MKLFRTWSDVNSCILEGDRINFQNLFDRRMWGEDRKKKPSETTPEFEELYRYPVVLRKNEGLFLFSPF